METLTLNFVTPEATFFSGPVGLVEAPGTLGDFGVLPGHMHFISTLRPGVVTIHDAQDKAIRVFVASGVAEVNPTSCTILADRVIELATLARADVEARLTHAKAALNEASDEAAKSDAGREVELAEALVAALAG
jgi:F-type H+-transporting ATPase subunit epsilon